MAINSIYAEVVLTFLFILPMAGFTDLDNSLIRIVFFINKECAGMRIMASDARDGKMFGIKQIIVLLIMWNSKPPSAPI